MICFDFDFVFCFLIIIINVIVGFFWSPFCQLQWWHVDKEENHRFVELLACVLNCFVFFTFENSIKTAFFKKKKIIGGSSQWFWVKTPSGICSSSEKKKLSQNLRSCSLEVLQGSAGFCRVLQELSEAGASEVQRAEGGLGTSAGNCWQLSLVCTQKTQNESRVFISGAGDHLGICTSTRGSNWEKPVPGPAMTSRLWHRRSPPRGNSPVSFCVASAGSSSFLHRCGRRHRETWIISATAEQGGGAGSVPAVGFPASRFTFTNLKHAGSKMWREQNVTNFTPG